MKFAGLASIAFVVGISLAAPSAWAADFTVTVPVDANGLPAGVNKMQTSCQIFTDANMPVVGAGMTETPITGRAYRGDVVVTINAQASVDPATATRYRCSVWFIAERAGAGGANIYYYQRETPDGGTFQNFPIVAGRRSGSPPACSRFLLAEHTGITTVKARSSGVTWFDHPIAECRERTGVGHDVDLHE